MPENSSSMQEVRLSAGTTKDLLEKGHIRQISLQTEGGQTLIGAPITIDATGLVPGIFKAPARAAACAIALVARIAGLKIVLERDE